MIQHNPKLSANALNTLFFIHLLAMHVIVDNPMKIPEQQTRYRTLE